MQERRKKREGNIPAALRGIFSRDEHVWMHDLRCLMQQKIERRLRREGRPADIQRRYRYHLLPETPAQILQWMYGPETAFAVLARWPRVAEERTIAEHGECRRVPEVEKELARMDDRWEERYRRTDTAFVREQYGAYPEEVADAIMDICLLSLRRSALTDEQCEKAGRAYRVLASVDRSAGDYRLDNLKEVASSLFYR